jgi:hypothetical protein
MMQSKLVIDNKFSRTFDRELTKRRLPLFLEIFFFSFFFSFQRLIIYSSVYMEYNYVLVCVGTPLYIYACAPTATFFF